MADLTNSFDNLYANRIITNESNQTNTTQLNDIYKELQNISDDIRGMSQSDARDRFRFNANWRDVGRQNDTKTTQSNYRNQRRRAGNAVDEFFDGIEDILGEALGTNKIKETLEGAMVQFADGLGVELEDMPRALGNRLAKDALNAFTSNDFGKQLSETLKKGQDKYLDRAKKYFELAGKQLKGEDFSQQASSSINSMFSDLSSDIDGLIPDSAKNKIGGMLKNTPLGGIAEKAGGAATRGLASIGTKVAGTALGSAAAGAGSLALGALGGPVGVAITGGLIVLEGLLDIAGKFFNAFGKFTQGLSKASNRDQESRRKQTEEGQRRLKADLETIVEQPFKVLESAMNEMVQAWNDGIRIINQTQGYSKEDLQSLIGSFASRIKSEGLQSMISASDLTTNLTNVLKSGLSGEVAEEFAYLATKLNAAIPTQDFFQYANTYASLAANAIKEGKSQSAAIQYANEQLELFASDVLYAGRQLSGGFSTGLQDANSIFQKAVEISVAARTNNPSEIAGVLTSVSAITGAIAPDLASAMVDAVYNAATGGNTSQIVALRSLAGINASNTEFLQELAKDPKKIFSELFKNLSDMQHMSDSNYMEVAEGLSNVFGLDKATFARVDFRYLADAINNMNVSTSSLDENMKQLASGESTLNDEQMKIRQINEYMMTNGLSYVLDNEAARAIQQHMWDEQIAIENREATYSVDLQGSALTFLNDIKDIVDNILGILNPIRMVQRLINLVQTVDEGFKNVDKVKAVLEAGKVGQGNQKVLKQLTTYGQRLNVTNSLLSMLQQNASGGSANYSWNSLSKSAYASLGTSARGFGSKNNTGVTSRNSSSSANLTRMQQNVNRMISNMSNFFGTTVEDKIETAITKETSKLVKASVNNVSESKIQKLVSEYLSNPDKYGIGKIVYESKLGGEFNKESQNRLNELVREKVVKDLEEAAKADASAKAYINVMKLANAGKFGKTGYEAWAETSNKYGISDLNATLDELGYSISDVRGYFETLETQLAARQALQRQKNEETFWSETQRLLNQANTNIYDVLDKGDLMGIFWPGVDTWLADIDSNGQDNGKGFRGDVNSRLDTINTSVVEFKGMFKSHFIDHATYTKNLTGEDTGSKLLQELSKVQNAKDKTTEDVLNALTEALMNNPAGDLLDPTVQQNMFLAAILQGVQAIVQQNNTQGKLKLPDAISALATGMTSVDTSAAGSVVPTTTDTVASKALSGRK